jgi:sugar/nucleoside kinase (ribokinase family)
LGLSTTLVTNVGKDVNGDKIVEYLKSESIDTSQITQQPTIPTNYHYVLWYEDERTILVHQNEYGYHFPDLPVPKIIYFSSIGAKALDYRDEMATYLEAHPAIFFAFQPGVFDIKVGAERLKRLYQRANLFVVNKEEAQRILGLPDTADDIQPLLDGVHALGPKTVVITDYLDGAYGFENGTTVHLPMYKDDTPPVERTGAGDAFASTTTVYYGTGTPLKDAMYRGLINASHVVQEIGAQRGLQKRDSLESTVQNNPLS